MTDKPVDPGDALRAVGDAIREDFVKNKRVLSFAEYLDLCGQSYRQLRSAPQYIKDCFDYFGADEIAFPRGTVRRFRLFDCPWADGRDRLVGQEEVQNRVYRALKNFVNEGAANKLVLLHGPNGSAKTTLIRCIGRAMQHYSTLDEGALYRINWIFPAQKLSKSGIGFGGGYDDVNARDTFAYLPDDMIDAKVVDELRDHPLFLIPPARRRDLLESIVERTGARDAGFVLSDYIQYGQLSAKNKAIYEALLASYQGDYLKVLRHVQVERFYIQHRYRCGYVTVEPQLAVDATERQVTADRSIAALPAALQTVALFEYGGELVGANRGLIEYSDLLKRPIEAYKYLLTTVERSTVSLQTATLYLDLVYLGTSNEIHLNAFKELPEFQSFKGRLDLIRVPYLLDYTQEEQIYAQKLREAASDRHVQPHCAYVAALWAVLTRMRKPLAERYPKQVADLVARLTPLQKAELYATGAVPDDYTVDQAKLLRAHLSDLWHESDAYPSYEGRTGASPREMQTVLFNAANSSTFDYVSVEAVLAEIEELTRQVSVYEFLKQEPLPGGYHDHAQFIEIARRKWLDRVDEEVRAALNLVEEGEYQRLFAKYVTHVTYWTRNEKVFNEATGRSEDPDEELMREVERTLEVTGPADEFRKDLIARIGAWSLDHRGQKADYEHIFPKEFRKLRDAYFRQRREIVGRAVRNVVAYLTDGDRVLDDEAKAAARDTIDALVRRFGYIEASARDAVRALAKARYAE
ncbi:MAG: serine protein kinase PrkA [Deltaproteobacteria bacterium]|nr:MAG: serine protein kinase PrkA [Deltaproteobacteria bacterium]